jgi:hypothetical protein
MNAGPADTRSPHLDLGDLIAEVTGQPVDDRAREHLARCEHCRAEANRWDLVAGGIRSLTAATPEAAQPAPRPRHTGPRVLANPRRRTMLAASAAAALVLIGAAGYGVTAALTRHAHGTVLTAVSGCAGIELASGTLEPVSGSRLVIKTASGQPVTVITTASTKVSVAGPLLGDITDGASVIVLGPRSGGTVAAAAVTVGPPPSGTGNGALSVTPPPGWAAVQGTVADAGTAGFTVVTPGGTRVPVTTSGDTHVVVPRASLGQLQAGVTTVAVGHAGPHQTLTAIGVLQQPAGGQIRVQFNVSARGCSHASLAAALNAAFVSGG